jgi:hypothetical protein
MRKKTGNTNGARPLGTRTKEEPRDIKGKKDSP